MIEAESARHVLSQMITGCWISQAIYVAAEIAIADLLAEALQSSEQLAQCPNTHTGADACLLRHVIHDREDDDDALLCNCRSAINTEARILVIASIIPQEMNPLSESCLTS